MFNAGTPRAIRLLLGVLAVWLTADVALTLIHGPGHTPRWERLIYDCMLVVAAGVAFARGGPWRRAAIGMAAWGLGDLFYTSQYWTADHIPIPSPADVGYLLLPPLVASGFLGLLRRQRAAIPLARRVDGATAALSVAAISAAIVWRPVREAASGNPLAVATNLAYPLLDLGLLGVCVGALASRGFALDRLWVVAAAGVLAFWLADSLYLVHTAQGDYQMGSWFDEGWSLGIVLLAFAAWQPPPGKPIDDDQLRVAAGPLASAAVALVLLVAAGIKGFDALPVLLAAIALLTTGARLMLTFRENTRVLAASRQEAATDSLTGLGNRRGLMRDLERALAPGAGPAVLLLADLDGFKSYNDTFGHPAGDALLARLGARLRQAVEGRGSAYRMGGDEFCVLVSAAPGEAFDAVAAVRASLIEQGDGFSVSCSAGLVLLPVEAAAPDAALRIADQRLYAAKHSGRASAGRQSKDVLLRALVERSPELVAHATDVAVLARAVAGHMGLSDGESLEVRHAAELHDVGKVAIPDAILVKAGSLSEVEWAYVRQHTVIGERILLAAPALARVAGIVRSTHERWDGGGYPDGLVAEAIPLGARIVAVADAYDAIVSGRPYAPPRSPQDAVEELRRCAGTQFDPAVVDAFCAVLEDSPPAHEPSGAVAPA